MTTIVAFGDSTTAPRGPLTVYADILREELPRHNRPVNVVNAGVGGNTTADGRQRWQSAVLDHKPDLTIIQFGINDAAIDLYKDPPATAPRVSLTRYIANLEYFLGSLQSCGSKAILMTPNPLRWTPKLLELYGKPPYQPAETDGFNILLRDYAAAVRDIARDHNTPLIDIYTLFQAHNQANATTSDLLLDGMHPNESGHRLVADQLLAHIPHMF